MHFPLKFQGKNQQSIIELSSYIEGFEWWNFTTEINQLLKIEISRQTNEGIKYLCQNSRNFVEL